jgi:hypothetical protein
MHKKKGLTVTFQNTTIKFFCQPLASMFVSTHTVTYTAYNKTGNVCINVILRGVHAIIVAVENQ